MDVVEEMARALWAHHSKDFPERVKETWEAEHPLGRAVKEMQRNFQRRAAEAVIEHLSSLGYVIVRKTLVERPPFNYREEST